VTIGLSLNLDYQTVHNSVPLQYGVGVSFMFIFTETDVYYKPVLHAHNPLLLRRMCCIANVIYLFGNLLFV